MISSQNNARKYPTKGHEQVLYTQFCNQSGNIECFPLMCESNSSSEIVTKSQSVHLKCLRCFFMSISSATGTLHTPHNNIPRRAGGVDTLVFWVLLSTIDLSPLKKPR